MSGLGGVLLLAGAVGVFGLVAGWMRPAVGLAFFVGAVAAVPTLSGVLGLPHVSLGLAFLIPFLAGRWTALLLRSSRRPADGSTGWRGSGPFGTRWAASSTIAATSMAVVIVAPRTGALSMAAASWPEALAALLSLNPSGGFGAIQTALVAVLGPLVLLTAVPILAEAGARRLVCRAFLMGAAVVLALSLGGSVLAWFPGGPDGGMTPDGLAGPFLDVHSFAAFLVLALGVSAGWVIGQPRLDLLAALVALGCLPAILLSQSRAGFLSAAAAVAVLALVRTTGPERQRFAAGIVTLGLVGLGVAVPVSVAVGSVASGPLGGSPAPDSATQAENRAPAFLEISSLERRALLLGKAWHLVGAHPVWGIGPQGFYDRQTGLAEVGGAEVTGAVSRRALQPARLELRSENAHNYPLQYAAEFGLPAMLAWVWLLLATIGAALAAAHAAEAAGEQRSSERGVGGGLAAGLAGFVTMGFASHPMLLAELQGAFWILAAVSVASLMALSPGQADNTVTAGARRLFSLVAATWATAVVLTLVGWIGLAEPAPEDTGYHHWEIVRQPGRPPELVRWTAAERSVAWVEVAGDRLILPLRLTRPTIPAAGVVIEVNLAGQALGGLRLRDEGAHTATFYVPAALGRLLSGGNPGDAQAIDSPTRPTPGSRLPLELLVSDSEVPAARPGGRDLRRLGVAVGEIEWRRGRPGRALGVEPWEIDTDGRRYRWTGRVASIPVAATGDRLAFELRASHPDAAGQPVVVEILWDATPLSVARITDTGWQALQIDLPADASPTGVLTIRVDRTWNPRQAGVSADNRDLGVAITALVTR